MASRGARWLRARVTFTLPLPLYLVVFLSVYVSDLPVHIWGAANSSLLTSPSIATAGKTMAEQNHRNGTKQ